MSDVGVVKRNLDWTATESLARGLRIPWSPYVIHKLKVCEAVIRTQESNRIDAANAKAKAKSGKGYF